MATPWCRLWADMPNDPKWRTISKASKQPIASVVAVYVHLMICASNATERGRTQGWCNEDVANALDLETPQIEAIIKAMEGRVLEGGYLTGWTKRQPAREDGAAERAKSWRNKKKEEEGKEAERKRTQTNAGERPEVEVEVDSEVDKEKKESKRFVPPSESDVETYMSEIGFKGDAGKFVDFYTSKDWMVGKNKMKDWKAAVRTWRGNSFDGGKKTAPESYKQDDIWRGVK